MGIFDDYQPQVRNALPALVAQRWISNVGVRMMFTFLPAVATGSGLSIPEIGRLLTLRDLTGLAAPALGRTKERRGARIILLLGGLAAAVGLLLSVLSPIGLIIGFTLMGIGKVAYDVALNSWIGDQVAYERRARAFGILELSWASAALVGLPICGLLIEKIAWWAAPTLFGVLGILATARLHQVMPKDTSQTGDAGPPLRITATIIWTLTSLAALIFGSQLIFVSHGLWLNDAHGLSPSTIGSVVIVFGVIEAVATLTTTAFTDRLGKQRSVIAGAVLLLVGSTGLAWVTNPSLPLGLFLLALAFLGFEFAFVSSLPLVAELDPVARARAMGLTLGMATLVRAVGSLVATRLYVGPGFTTVMTVSAGSIAVGLAIMSIINCEPVPSPQHQKVME